VRESEARLNEERATLEAQLAETAKRAENKLRAERQRLAVRYSNQGKQLVRKKLTEAQRDFDEQLCKRSVVPDPDGAVDAVTGDPATTDTDDAPLSPREVPS